MLADAPRTLLLLRFSAIGDIVLTSAVVESLARVWPSTRIVFATKKRFSALMENNPHLHAVVGLGEGESLAEFRRRLAAFEPDALLDLHGKARGFLLRGLVPRGRRTVWKKRPWLQGLAVRMRLSPYHASKTVCARYHDAVEELVGRSVEKGRLRYYVAKEANARVTEMLSAGGGDSSKPLVGMAPGSMWETKRWPVEAYGELAARCIADGARVVLTGSRSEAAIIEQVARSAPGVFVPKEELGLAELGALVKACDAFVANDSAPMHIARAMGVPTLAIFGSTDPGQFDFDGHELMYADVPCSPCSLYGLRRCPKKHFDCMRKLSVDSAKAALEKLLVGGRRPHLSD